MTTEQMRNAIRDRYGPSWSVRVEKMSDGQVYAIYNRILNEKRN